MGAKAEVRVRVSRSVVGDAEIDAVTAVLKRGFLGMGSEVRAFEEELAQFIGSERTVVCVSNGTAALHAALQASGVGPGDEVLLPTLTYIASFQAVSGTGATPVACDVNPHTCWMDVDDAAGRITPRTKAIMPVHYASGCGELERIYALAQEHGLRVIEDAAHAFGCRWQGQIVGSQGEMACFSFDGIKNITSGEGGAVVTGDPEIASRLQDIRLLGVQRDTEQRFQGRRSWEFDVTEQGWRYHMSDIMAAIGRVQLRRFPEFADARVQLAQRYQQGLGHCPGIQLLDIDYGPVVPHIFPILVQDGKRDRLREALGERGIETGIHYKPNHLLSKYGGGTVRLPGAEKVYQELLTLPLHPLVTREQGDEICRQVMQYMETE
ncbi:MAG: DegT/DnrJ/EryC1/StrS family aminotransferase [Candidatus Eisenbacteria sp.]|nr:DegT/DnrJ/EryC1/StrS family aminotransferase [Candidatus Eisenbacteria bacterium]